MRAAVRTEAGAGALRRVGIDAVQGDIFDIQSLRRAIKDARTRCIWQRRYRLRAKCQNWALNSGSIMSTVDDQPTTYRELFSYIALFEGGPTPTAGGASNFPSFRISSSNARELLGWRPFYRSHRSGLA